MHLWTINTPVGRRQSTSMNVGIRWWFHNSPEWGAMVVACNETRLNWILTEKLHVSVTEQLAGVVQNSNSTQRFQGELLKEFLFCLHQLSNWCRDCPPQWVASVIEWLRLTPDIVSITDWYDNGTFTEWLNQTDSQRVKESYSSPLITQSIKDLIHSLSEWRRWTISGERQWVSVTATHFTLSLSVLTL